MKADGVGRVTEEASETIGSKIPTQLSLLCLATISPTTRDHRFGPSDITEKKRYVAAGSLGQ